MRVLVATTAGAGHLGPMLPFARALRDAGHEVDVAAPECFAGAVERSGFPHRPFPDVPPVDLEAVFRRLPALPVGEARSTVITEVFGRLDTGAALPGMEAMVAARPPDLVLREPCELSSYLVAEAAGIPHAQVAIGLAWFHHMAADLWEEPLVELGATSGLAGLRSAPQVSLVPPSFEDPDQPAREGTARFRDGIVAPSGASLPDWWAGADDPLVYVTFGSVAAGLGLFPSLYVEVVTALAGLPARVLLTVGDRADPAELGPLPGNVHVERWWPQDQVVGAARAMIGHGGFGTTLAGLAAGVPMVVLPLFADQPENAARVHALGAGIALEGGPGAVGGLAAALERVLADESFRACAGRVAAEVAALPPATDAVPMLEALAGR